MAYEAKNYDHLLGTPGFSDKLLKDHFTLYQGYVAQTNKLVEEFTAMLKEGKTAGPRYAEMKRRFGWEFNGMRLHELYFGGMAKGGKPFDKESDLARQMKEDFGSVEAWEKAFKAVGAMRGIGWAMLCYDPQEPSLYNVWINEHNANLLAGTTPLLILDVFEHAFMTDYGVKRDGYIEAFFKAVDWSAVLNRFQSAAAKELALT
jgi:superoxide dismutase, Fe-Mn family